MKTSGRDEIVTCGNRPAYRKFVIAQVAQNLSFKMLALNFNHFSIPKLNSDIIVSAASLFFEVNREEHKLASNQCFDEQPREGTCNCHGVMICQPT